MKAWISDFDGTLRLYGKTGPYFLAEDLAAVREFQNEGGLFGICSGRSLMSLLSVMPEELKPDFCILTSGAAIVKMRKTLEFLAVKAIDSTVIRDMYCRFADSGKVYIHTTDSMYAFRRRGEALPEKVRRILKDPDELLELDILGMSIGTESEAAAAQTAEQINEAFGAWVTAYQNIDYIDIVRNDCSKGSGVAEARKLFGLTKLYGIGDSYNDIPLLDAVDTAFTFERSPEGVQAHADHVVKTSAEAIGIAAGEK
ncbi:MAG: HAD hydrolase family protein [Solobacterium sp.]|nr:HAD hydrolase family protein [Solobacterium sp.]